MSIIAEKAGEVHVRVGGNTQDTAYMVDSLPDGKFLDKNREDASNPVRSEHRQENFPNHHLPQTGTPIIAITPDLLFMLANVSSLVNIKWYLGIPFNDTNWRFQIAEKSEAILGDNLLGLQAANEPDLYARYVSCCPRRQCF